MSEYCDAIKMASHPIYKSNNKTNNMQLIKPHHEASKKVKRLRDIKKDLGKLLLLTDEDFPGNYKTAYSLAHCETREQSFAFFVVNQILVENKTFKHQVFINPEITGISKKIVIKNENKDQILDNKMEIEEACMMFPDRRPKKLSRPYKIEVKYKTPVFGGLFMKTVRTKFEGLQSQIFQHNLDHINGKNIYFED